MPLVYLGLRDDENRLHVEAIKSTDASPAVGRVLQNTTLPEQQVRAFRTGPFKVYVQRQGRRIAAAVSDTEGEDTLAAGAIADAQRAYGDSSGNALETLLYELLDRFNKLSEVASGHKFKRLQDDLGKLKANAIEQVDMLMERTENIDILVEKTGSLSTKAQVFRRTATSYRKQLQWADIKGWVCAAMVVLLMLAIIYISVHA